MGWYGTGGKGEPYLDGEFAGVREGRGKVIGVAGVVGGEVAFVGGAAGLDCGHFCDGMGWKLLIYRW